MNRKKGLKMPLASEKRFEFGFPLLAQWLGLRQRGESLCSYFEDNGIDHVAIYGMGVLGERLYEELREGPVSVEYAIDRMAAFKDIPGLQLYLPDIERLPDVGAVIVTPVQEFWRIVELLETKTDAPILSLSDIVDYCVLGG